jgi:hypothetical protein
MEFKTARPYLHQSIVAFYEVLYGSPDWYNTKQVVLETTVATAGHLLAERLAKSLGLSKIQFALLVSTGLPNAARIGIGGHFVITGILGAIAAVKTHNYQSLVQHVALAACGYVTNTRKYGMFVNTFVEKCRVPGVSQRVLAILGIGLVAGYSKDESLMEKAALFTAVVSPNVAWFAVRFGTVAKIFDARKDCGLTDIAKRTGLAAFVCCSYKLDVFLQDLVNRRWV